ncbi:MAG: hypothetical protein IJ300_06785 [Clostridia bacterium]|nr:hypothetical protein [Clostridia bacterium]
MCGLFGFYNYGKKPINNLSKLTNVLAENAAVRGTDATGIAYNLKGRLVIHKEAKSAYMVDFKHSDDTICVMGHTRHATQGNEKRNYNNHPFGGSCKNLRFALAHNGVLVNDIELKKQYSLPKTKIETDSYVAVQLIEKKKQLDNKSIKFMAENVSGGFSFSILDSSETLWLIRGDSPLSLIHLPAYKLYVYASTEEILYKALVDTKLFTEIKSGNFEELETHPGDIWSISTDGNIVRDKFKYIDCFGFGSSHWWDYDVLDDKKEKDLYIKDLKTIAAYQGYSSDEIDKMISYGWSFKEIEDYIYCME